MNRKGHRSSQPRTRRRLQCINCNICVNTLRRFAVLTLDARIITVISNWIYPETITDDDYICEECWESAIQTVNDALNRANNGEQQAAGSSHQVDRLVCIVCGRSLIRRQSEHILRRNASALQRNIANIIQASTAPRRVTPSDRVCRGCWLKSKRSALRTQQVNRFRSPLSEVLNYSDLRPMLPERDLQQILDNSVPILSEIAVPNYRRAANTASRCLFPDCTNDHDLNTVSNPLRTTVLSNNNYYIPERARVCSEHLRNNNWNNLYNSSNSIRTFNAQQIQHILTLINTLKKYLDSCSIGVNGNMNDEVRRFQEQEPARRSILTIAAWLLAIRTGETDERIATLYQVEEFEVMYIRWKN